ncbi:Hypothetical protein, putative [Bodo saltans]|uniref:BEACH domain-containing protein n=1 Tax=Bodo saltans TaxID=75058 RepID=A0A0S4IPI8_BODSA|nr:Hypothetical protein, putative [Bodo saltans]|eukprot:CUE73475.1 Hypothetical protein, putative [Bodo saltans]
MSFNDNSSSAANRRSATSLYREFGMIPTSVSTPSQSSPLDSASYPLVEPSTATSARSSMTGEVGTTAQLSSSSSAAAASVVSPTSPVSLLRLWQQVEMCKDNPIRQKSIIVDSLYEPFVTQCVSSASAPYRQAFGDGSSLVSVLCRLLCTDARSSLRAGFPECASTAKALLDEPTHMIMLSYFSTICDPTFFPGSVELRYLDSIVRILALHNIPSILISLHRTFLDLVEDAKRTIHSTITPQMAAADQKYLALLQNFLSFQHTNTQPLLADILQVNGIVHIAETISTALTVPFWASGSIAELAASMLLSLLHRNELKAVAFSGRVIEEVETVLVDGILKDADSATEEFGDASKSTLKLTALTQCLAVLLALRKNFCTPFNANIDFGLVVTVLLSIQESMASQRRLTQRLLSILNDFMVTPLGPSGQGGSKSDGSGSSSSGGGGGGKQPGKGFSFSALASHVGKMVSSAVASGDKAKSNDNSAWKVITASQVVEGMCQFIICAANDDARILVAQNLFEFLQVPKSVEPAFLLTQLTSIAESVPTMSLHLLTEFLQVAEDVAHRHDASNVLIVLSRKLTDVENTPELHILKLISFFASLGTRSHVAANAVLACGAIRNSTKLVEMIGCFSCASELLHHIHHLWMTVCRVPGCADLFESSGTAEVVTRSMLFFGLARAVRPEPMGKGSVTNRIPATPLQPQAQQQAVEGAQLRREILRVSREALATLISTRSNAVHVLLDRLLQHTGKVVWTDEVSCLLGALAYVLHSASDSRCATEAIKGNAIELCLSLLQSVESENNRVDEETALLSTCLTAMLPCVRFSEVGRMLAVSIPTSLVGSTALCQMLADLSLGSTRDPRHVESLLLWYDIVLSATPLQDPIEDWRTSWSGRMPGGSAADKKSSSAVDTSSPVASFQRLGNAVGGSDGTIGPFVVPRSKRFFCELTFPLLELCRWYRAEVLNEEITIDSPARRPSHSVLPTTPAAVVVEPSVPSPAVSLEDLTASTLDISSAQDGVTPTRSQPQQHLDDDEASVSSPQRRPLRRHSLRELAQLVRAVASRLAAPLSDPTFAEFVLRLGLYDLVPFIANVAASNDLKRHFFFDESTLSAAMYSNNNNAGVTPSTSFQALDQQESLGATTTMLNDGGTPITNAPKRTLTQRNLTSSRQVQLFRIIRMWQAAVVPRVAFNPDRNTQSVTDRNGGVGCAVGSSTTGVDPCRVDFPHHIQFFGSGGAEGDVRRCGEEGWPSPDGYSVCAWCWWVDLESGGADGAPRTEFNANARSTTSRSVLPIWQCEWRELPDPTSPVSNITCYVDLVEKKTMLDILYNAIHHTVELPLIAPSTWAHIAVSHQRNRLFNSEVSVYMDGALVKKTTLTYPLTALTQATGFSPCKQFHCRLGFPAQQLSSGPMIMGVEGDNASMTQHRVQNFARGDDTMLRLKLGPFQVYNSPLSQASIMSLFAASVHNLQAGRWFANGDASVSTSAVVFDRAVLNFLAASASNDLLQSTVQSGQCSFVAAPQSRDTLLVSVHPSAAALADASFRYLDNHDWTLVNLADASSRSTFTLYGPHSEPTVSCVDAAHALVACGGTTEWMNWLSMITDIDVEDVDDDPQADDTDGCASDNGELDLSYNAALTTQESVSWGLTTAVVANSASNSPSGAWSLRKLARGAISVIASCVARVSVKELRHRAFYYNIALLIRKNPRLFLVPSTPSDTHLPFGRALDGTINSTTTLPTNSLDDARAFATIASLCFTLVHADGAALGSRALTDEQICRRSLLLPVLSNTALFEMVFAKTSIWANLPHSSAISVLQYIAVALHPGNRYRRLNARRMQANGFMTSFVYGIVRHYVPLAVLPTVMDTMSAYISAMDDDGSTVSEILTFLAASVPTGAEEDNSGVEKRLGSRLAMVAPEYIALVRNLLLKSIVELAAVPISSSAGDTATPSTGAAAAAAAAGAPVANRTLLQTIAEVVPLSWVHAMTGPYSHPSTVALALQLTVVLLQYQQPFRQRAERSNLLHLLTVNLSHYSHQPDITSLLLHGFLGHSRDVLVFQSALLDDNLAPNPHRGVPFLIHLVMSLQKCNAISSRDPSQIESATKYYDQAPACAYFSQVNRFMSRASVVRGARRLRAVMHLVRCIRILQKNVELGRSRRGTTASASVASPAGAHRASSSTQQLSTADVTTPVANRASTRRCDLMSPAEHQRKLQDECLRRMDLVSRVLNWAAFAFLKHDYVACALFNPGALCASSSGISMSASSSLPNGLNPTAIASFQALPQLYGETYPIDFLSWMVVCALGQADPLHVVSNGSQLRGNRFLETVAAPEASPQGATAPRTGSDDDEPGDGFGAEAALSATSGAIDGDASRGDAAATQCRSAGLDRLPPPAYEPLFQACCNMYVAMMELQVRDYVAIYVGKQNIKTSPFALVLHHVLCLCPSGIGDEAESWYHAALISLWLQTTTRALQRHSLQGDRGHHLSKNCVSVGHYVVERLLSGLPTPPGAVMEFLTVLLGALQYSDHIKQTRHLILEWGCFILSPKFHNNNLKEAQVARDLIFTHRHVLFGPHVLGQATIDAQRHLLVKMLELSAVLITNYDSTQTPEAQRIAELWLTVLQAMKQSPALSYVLAEGCGLVKTSSSAHHHYDFLHGGFDILYHRIGATSMFLSWFADTRYAIKDYLTHHAPVQPFHQLKLPPTAGLVVLGKKYMKWVCGSVKLMQKSRSKQAQKAESAVLHVTQSYEKLLSTGTFVDPKLLLQRDYARSDVLVVASPSPEELQQQEELYEASTSATHCRPVFKNYWTPHAGGVRSTRWYASEARSQSRLVDLNGEPLGVYFSDVPVAMVPLLAGSTVDGMHVHHQPTMSNASNNSASSASLPLNTAATGNTHGLKPNAIQILHRILDAGSVQPKDSRILWIGNVYYIVGTESVICTLVLTRTEMVWISHSQATKHGDFFITQIATHTAADKAHKKRSAPGAAAIAIQDAIGRFLPKASAFVASATGVSSAKLASLSTHRHSQYYRQLRTEALQRDHAAFVSATPLSSLSAAHHRRFQHQNAALEVASECGASHFFVVLDHDMNMTSDARNRLADALRSTHSGMIIETEKTKEAKVLSAQKRWVKGALSTRSYLAVLNDAASRTTSDLSQYPVMPWVLSQYDEIFVDLNDPSNYRDLSKPMGAINPANAVQIKHRFDDWPDDTQPPFHYGTHYSTSAVAMYYLVRLEPKVVTSHANQGGRLDVADRLFHSVAEAWLSASGAGSDVKELVPEFFSTACWVRNDNSIALGERRDGVSLNHVVLPPWCGGRPDVFTATLCEAIESDTVGASIHEWFDLVFGFRQRGEEAVKALNIFHHLSYDEGLETAMEAASNEEDRNCMLGAENSIALGERRDGVSLNHVVLPPWCGGRPDVFTATLCEAIESDTVGASIHEWFDLVFGFRQRGEEAIKALNIFHHLSYDEGLETAMEAASNEEDRKAIVASVDNFGLTPRQLFSVPHPARAMMGGGSHAATNTVGSSGSPAATTTTTAAASSPQQPLPASPAPRQITFLAALGQLVKRTQHFVLHVPASPISHQRLTNETITEVQLLDSMIYASTTSAKYCGKKAMLVVYVEESSSSVHVSSLASPSGGGPSAAPGGVAVAQNAGGGGGNNSAASGQGPSQNSLFSGTGLVLPGCTSFGSGWVTSVCASACGNIVVCGTNKGCVVVYGRSTADSAFSISNFIYAAQVGAMKEKSTTLKSPVVATNSPPTPAPPPPSSASRSQGRVRLVQLWNDGQLLVSTEPGTLSAWHVTNKAAAFCFAVDVAAEIHDHTATVLQQQRNQSSSFDATTVLITTASFTVRSPQVLSSLSPVAHVVRFVCRDEEHKHYYVATDHHVLVLSSIGAVLSVLWVEGTNPFDPNTPSQPALAASTIPSVGLTSSSASASFSTRSNGALGSAVLSSQTLVEPITSIAYCNFKCHSSINVLMCGHANGCASVWTVFADVSPSSPSIRSIRFHSCLAVEKGTAVTSIAPVMETSMVIFGLSGGGVVVLGLPPNVVVEGGESGAN